MKHLDGLAVVPGELKASGNPVAWTKVVDGTTAIQREPGPQHLDDHHIPAVADEGTASGRQNDGRQCLMTKLMNLRCEEGGDVMSHMSQLLECRESLANMNKPIPDDFFKGHMISTLPSSSDELFANIKELVDVGKTPDGSSAGPDLALQAGYRGRGGYRGGGGGYRGGSCYRCGEVGHIERYCSKPPQFAASSSSGTGKPTAGLTDATTQGNNGDEDDHSFVAIKAVNQSFSTLARLATSHQSAAILRISCQMCRKILHALRMATPSTSRVLES